MLVLARKINQSIMIGHDIEICLVDIKGEQVKIGITAPKHISVHRKEVYEEIQSANIEAGRNAKKSISSLKNFNLMSYQKKKNDKNNPKEI